MKKRWLPALTGTLLVASLLTVGCGGKKAPNRIAVLETSMGTIKFELYEDKAPITTANFIKLAESSFYDGLVFHRVVDNFVIQTGDPLGNGTGGSAENINLEIKKSLTHTDGA